MIKHKLTDLVKKDLKIKGIYRGVVEDIVDPLNAGRVRCRIYGLHTTRTSLDEYQVEGIPTEHLPWCEPALPITEAGVETGIFGVPSVGSHVLIFFENENILKPIYFAFVPAKTDWSTDATQDKFLIKTSGGHIIEFDSTSGSETMKIEHPTGTKVEVSSDGAISIEGSKTCDITLSGNMNITITGNCTVTTTGVINLN